MATAAVSYRPEIGLLHIQASEIGDDIEQPKRLACFYLRFAGRTERLKVETPRGIEEITSEKTIRGLMERSKAISRTIRAASFDKQFSKSVELAELSVYPAIGLAYSPSQRIHKPRRVTYAFYSEDEATRLNVGEKSTNLTKHPPTSHLRISIDEDRHLYSVQYLAEAYNRLILDVSFFMRGLICKEFLDRGRFSEFVIFRQSIGKSYLRNVSGGLTEDLESSIIHHSSFRSIGLSKLYPLLVDEKVQEIYLDRVGKRIYVDHSLSGRLLTNIRPRRQDIEALVTNLRRNSGRELDARVPSIKGDLQTDLFISRVAIDCYPLVDSEYAFDIRKLRPRPFSLLELTRQGSIDDVLAAILISAIVSKMNISIVGEPGSGKTTLLCALDLVTPPWWRKIYIEDAVELRSYSESNSAHCLRIIVDPFESSESSRRKSDEIIKVLHRNPSYVVLGEVQFKDHFKALFQAMAAGIKLIHTAHAPSGRGFIQRVVNVYGIPSELVSNLDVLVEMEKLESFRDVRRVVSGAYFLTGNDPSGKEQGQQSSLREIGRCPRIEDGHRILEELETKNRKHSGSVVALFDQVLDSIHTAQENGSEILRFPLQHPRRNDGSGSTG